MVAFLILASVVATAQPANTGKAIVLVAGQGGARCLPDQTLCWSIKPLDDGKGWMLHQQSGPNRAERDVALSIPKDDDHSSVTLWSQVITAPAKDSDGSTPPSLLIGIVVETRTMYSGGGGAARWLKLYSLDRQYGTPELGNEVLAVPISANKLIRACFSEQDYKRRRNACHDEYGFEATLDVVQGAAAGWPRLTYVAKADGFPDGASLDRDSTADRPLKKRDLVRAADPVCSFTRTATYNPLTERYEFDSPSPDCSDYWTL